MMYKMTFGGFIYLLICFFRSRIFYRNARLIRFPFDIRGKKNISWGKNFTTGRGCRMEVVSLSSMCSGINIGENFQMNDYCHIAALENITIGNNVLIASKVYISDCLHGKYDGEEQSDPYISPQLRKLSSKPVIIEDNVWIGDNVVILPGVTIGFGSIIAASAVVTKSVPEFSIAAGIPAKVIKKYDAIEKKWFKE